MKKPVGKTGYIKMGSGIEKMLETPQERVKLLKAGISPRDIEKLYIIYNDFKVVCSPVLYESNNQKHNNDIKKKIKYLMLNSSKS